MRNRPALTVRKLRNYLRKINPGAEVYIAPSIVNLDEPEETQEFILGEGVKCVAIESTVPLITTQRVTLGWASDYKY